MITISICIPQYNRIEILEISLRRLEKQNYAHVEVVVSDDCSTDNTEEVMREIQKDYKLPLVFHRNEENLGYDRNYRKCIELASGDYCFVLGNDDTLIDDDVCTRLAAFLEENNYPEIGYCNYIDEKTEELTERAAETGIVGKGVETALSHYNGFSFVAGLIYKKESFDKYNTGKHDGSIYSQMYLGLLMIASGCRLFTIVEPLVVKDLASAEGKGGWSYYKDGLPKKWSEFRVMDGGLPSVANVLIDAVEDATGVENPSIAYRILRRIYAITLPYWIIQYKKWGGFAAATGLIYGIFPGRVDVMNKVGSFDRLRIYFTYLTRSFAATLFPHRLWEPVEKRLYIASRAHR